jgi:hypothetical protein
VLAPLLFGALVGTGSRAGVLDGYLAGAALMVGASIVAAFLAVSAEGRSLEELASMRRRRAEGQLPEPARDAS